MFTIKIFYLFLWRFERKGGLELRRDLKEREVGVEERFHPTKSARGVFSNLLPPSLLFEKIFLISINTHLSSSNTYLPNSNCKILFSKVGLNVVSYNMFFSAE